MPRHTKPLTTTVIKNAKPAEKEYNLFDGQGLSLRVRPSGSKFWILNYYRPFTGKRANISLGSYSLVPLTEARQLAIEMRILIKQGIDPREHREDRKRANLEANRNTLEYVARKWLKVKEIHVTEGYATDIMRSFELHLFPRLGSIPVHKLHARQTIFVLEPIAAKGHLETIKRLCQRLNEVMIYATNTGMIEHNSPCRHQQSFSSPTNATHAHPHTRASA